MLGSSGFRLIGLGGRLGTDPVVHTTFELYINSEGLKIDIEQGLNDHVLLNQTVTWLSQSWLIE